MLTISLFNLNKDKDKPEFQSNVTALVVRLHEEGKKIEDCEFIAGVIDGYGRPVGVVVRNEREGFRPKTWKRSDFIEVHLIKMYGGGFSHQNVINDGSNNTDMLDFFIESFLVNKMTQRGVIEEVRVQLLADLERRRERALAGNRDTADA